MQISNFLLFFFIVSLLYITIGKDAIHNHAHNLHISHLFGNLTLCGQLITNANMQVICDLKCFPIKVILIIYYLMTEKFFPGPQLVPQISCFTCRYGMLMTIILFKINTNSWSFLRHKALKVI